VLIRFEASNYRSIAEPVELSMVAIDRDRDAAREQPMLGESLLTRAAIYGPNASGKSNVIAALAWLRNAVQDSVRHWEDRIPVDPFAFAGSPPTSDLVFEGIVDNVRFEYILQLDEDRVHYEGLFHYPEKKRRRIFEREGNDLRLQRGLGALSGTRELLTARTLALSAARRFDVPLVSSFAQMLVGVRTFGVAAGVRRGWRFPVPDYERPFLDSLPSERDKALAMLRLADLGIEDVHIEPEEVHLGGTDWATRYRLSLVHRTAMGAVPLDLAAESEGTRTWLGLIGPVLNALSQGSIMIFDELDASLHPTLSVELLRIFEDRTLNPKGAQLIFTSHDTSLLNHLNRDEVWLTEKRPDGSTRLGALAEFAGERVRKSQNLESAYLHGRFGALPQVDQGAFLRALGLIG
jgi:energy-coupling factor transporter ATP-binding protein EcfA2